MHAIALAVDNLDAAIHDLRVKGVKVSDIAPGRDPNTRIASIENTSANGVPLILIERSKPTNA
jgi:hypothetical protein